MGKSLHVRLDETSAAALTVVRSDGLSDSRGSARRLREAAAKRQLRSSIAAEARNLAADDSDRAEMLEIREQLAELAPPLSD